MTTQDLITFLERVINCHPASIDTTLGGVTTADRIAACRLLYDIISDEQAKGYRDYNNMRYQDELDTLQSLLANVETERNLLQSQLDTAASCAVISQDMITSLRADNTRLQEQVAALTAERDMHKDQVRELTEVHSCCPICPNCGCPLNRAQECYCSCDNGPIQDRVVPPMPAICPDCGCSLADDGSCLCLTDCEQCPVMVAEETPAPPKVEEIPCGRCGGSGVIEILGRTHGDCPTCNGTGRQP